MSFHECELAVLRQAVDESEMRQGAKIANSPEVVQIIQILEDFLVHKRLICYGGTAINNILPKEAQFYDRSMEIPDYDFFSPNALHNAKELADKYYAAGYDEVEAKSGMHPGTYKVYVNYLPVADVTQLHPVLFDSLSTESITVAGIKYAPPNYLRMAMFLELSRPNGDVSRWEKVLKRINLLNRYYPLKPDLQICNTMDFQRGLDIAANKDSSESIYYLVRDSFIDQGVVFLGGYGTSLYSKYMEKDRRHQVERIPDFDVLAEDPQKCAMIVRDRLADAGFKGIKIVQHTPIGEVIPAHVEINLSGDVIALIYKPVACHSYNKLTVGGREVLVATIDTMLSFYLAFLYGDKPYFDKDRMLCMAAYLFEVEQKNSLEQKGLLKRFSLDCYGRQPTMEEIRAEKNAKYMELRHSTKPGDRKEFERWFLKYRPITEKHWLHRKRADAAQMDSKSLEPTRTLELSLSSETPAVRAPSPPPPLKTPTTPRSMAVIRGMEPRYTRKNFGFARNRRTRFRKRREDAPSFSSSRRMPYKHPYAKGQDSYKHPYAKGQDVQKHPYAKGQDVQKHPYAKGQDAYKHPYAKRTFHFNRRR